MLAGASVEACRCELDAPGAGMLVVRGSRLVGAGPTLAGARLEACRCEPDARGAESMLVGARVEVCRCEGRYSRVRVSMPVGARADARGCEGRCLWVRGRRGANIDLRRPIRL